MSVATPAAPAIAVADVTKRYPGRGGGPGVAALDAVSLAVAPGATLGVVGESGSGKSTLARCLLGLLPFDAGRIDVLGTDIGSATAQQLRTLRRDAQIVFQEPFESLDPRLRVAEAIAEPLRLHTALDRAQRRERAVELLGRVRLEPRFADRFPHQLSGGQQQRVNIARAIATDPRVLVLDEPTSSLDVSVRAEVLRLLAQLRDAQDLTYVLISHDLPTIRAMCTDIAVLYHGRLLELGPAERVLAAPGHSYTRFLLASALSLDPDERPSELSTYRHDPDEPARIDALRPLDATTLTLRSMP